MSGQQQVGGRDVLTSLLELEAELTLIAELRDTATDDAEFARFDAVWRSLDADHDKLLATLPPRALKQLERARVAKGLGGRA